MCRSVAREGFTTRALLTDLLAAPGTLCTIVVLPAYRVCAAPACPQLCTDVFRDANCIKRPDCAFPFLLGTFAAHCPPRGLCSQQGYIRHQVPDKGRIRCRAACTGTHCAPKLALPDTRTHKHSVSFRSRTHQPSTNMRAKRVRVRVRGPHQHVRAHHAAHGGGAHVPLEPRPSPGALPGPRRRVSALRAHGWLLQRQMYAQVGEEAAVPGLRGRGGSHVRAGSMVCSLSPASCVWNLYSVRAQCVEGRSRIGCKRCA